MEKTTSVIRQAALEFYELGWSPIPIKARSKQPNLHQLAPYLEHCATRKELESWSWPGVGIVTGPLSGILVLDVDGPEGKAVLEERGHLPTPMARTASGGLHLYFKCPDTAVRTGIRVAPGLDVKAAGGYVVAPPSVGPTGKAYEWIIGPQEAKPVEPPEWLMQLIEQPRRNGPAGAVGERIPSGQRNKTLTSLAGTMRRRGMSEAEILAALRVANEGRCDPPLEDEEVGKIVASVATYKPVGDVVRVSFNGRGGTPSPERFNLTDLGNAERFVAQHGENVRYCYSWGKWLIWTGTLWERDEAGKVHKLAKETVRSIYREAAAAETEDRRKALAQHATRSEAEGRIKAMLELAKSEVSVSPDELDADLWLLNCANGTIDLRTVELRKHRREDLVTKLAPVEYDPDATAPLWRATLDRVLPNSEIQAFFKRLCGCALTGDTSEHVLPMLYGTGANGKSTVLSALLEVLGGYGMQAAPDLLIAKRNSHPTELADLFGARFVASIEVEDGRRLAESLVKQLTGGDRVKARRMRQDFWEFSPTHKVFMAVNHKPEVRGTDNAIWRRIRLIPFTKTIPPAEQDKKLPERLRAELPGILAWAVEGCAEWQREGLHAPDEVRRATGEYRSEMDVIGAFLRDECEIGLDYKASFKAVYDRYEEWCEEGGEKPETRRKFNARLKERGRFTDRRSGPGGSYEWHGLQLLKKQNSGFAGKLKQRSETGYNPPENKSSRGNSENNFSSSVTSVEDQNQTYSEEGREECIHGVPGGCWLCNRDSDDKQTLSSKHLKGGESATMPQLREIDKLVKQGMDPEIARAEVLGQEGL